MKRLLSAMLGFVMSVGLIGITGLSKEESVSLLDSTGLAKVETDYEKIFLDYAQVADESDSHRLNEYASAFVLVDLNDDEVPELLSVSTYVKCYDENGEKIFDGAGIYFDKEKYADAGYTEYSYKAEDAFSIIDDTVVAQAPWRSEFESNSLMMPYLPDEYSEMETEEFCGLFKKKNGEYRLSMYNISGYDTNLSEIGYRENNFYYEQKAFTAAFYDSVEETSKPAVSARRYDEKNNKYYSCEETMKVLLEKYRNAEKSVNCSDWAQTEIENAKEYNLIPEKMLDDDLSETITREEFAAVAVKLYESLTGVELNVYDLAIYTFREKIIDYADSEYCEEIRKVWQNGITMGTSDGSSEYDEQFSPDLNITREQLATMIYRTVEKYGEYCGNKAELTYIPLEYQYLFADENQISDYAAIPIHYMHYKGVIKGIDEENFGPQMTATREQAILLSLRAYYALADACEEETKELKINYDAIKNDEAENAGELISGLKSHTYTIEQLSEILGVEFKQTNELEDWLGLLKCQSFEWEGYTVTIVTFNEEATSYEDINDYPTYVDCNDMVWVSKKINKKY